MLCRIVLLIGLIGGLHFLQSHILWVVLGFFSLSFVWLIMVHRQIKAKLSDLELPVEYVAAILRAKRLHYLGISLFVVCLFGGIVSEGIRHAIQSNNANAEEYIVVPNNGQVSAEAEKSASPDEPSM